MTAKMLEPAPPSSLPTWDECSERVAGDDATALERFIYEYDVADEPASGWFRYRLEHVVREAKS